ncbi:MAG: hypothetical protein WAZ98_00670 [Cyclobacteriaceae bacterium]
MSNTQARYYLNSLKKRYLLIGLTEAILIAVGIIMLVYGLTGLFIASASLKIVVAGVPGLLMFTARILQKNLIRFQTSHIIQFMNAQYPDLQESADLILLQEDELTLLQQLQCEKTLAAFENIYPAVKLPNRLVQAIGIFIGCSLSYFVLSGFAITETVTPLIPGAQQQIIPVNAADAVFIESLSIQVTPPSYTGIASYKSKNLSASIPEGSRIEWMISFSSQPIDAHIIFPGRDSARLNPAGNYSFTFSQAFATSAFYQLQWRDTLGAYRSDYYKIDLIKDQPPKITVANLEQFTALLHTDDLVIDVKADLRDDYGLNDSQLIATVSKGSGEGIKFREEKIRFTTPPTISGKHLTANTTLNLKKLGLEPGDELYFYVEATDNKTPLPNRNRTETFFISLKDTASYILTADEGLGVDLMPEYFRSQRQIIIDTEKLLKHQKEKKISKEKFNATSNELGYDQKVLRLKYGQFLGEEEDSGIPHGTGPGDANHQEEDDAEKDPIKAFGHQHDTKNEHNLVADKKTDTHHHEEELSEEDKENPLKDFVHQHDNQEEATFFMVSVKTKLKMALSLMWDAELYLRIYTPAQSLPYQYKALNLLKEISNDSRIYVHRMGFDPPPLKEEKRLTADLAEVQSSTNHYFIVTEKKFQAIREGFSLLEARSLQDSPQLNASDKRILTKAGEELAQIAVAQPGTSLQGLSLIRDLLDEKIPVDKMQHVMKTLQQEFWKILPPQPAFPKKQETIVHELDQKFIQQLEELKHE